METPRAGYLYWLLVTGVAIYELEKRCKSKGAVTSRITIEADEDANLHDFILRSRVLNYPNHFTKQTK